MPVWLILSLGISATAVLVKLFRRRYQIVRYCSEEHRVGPVILGHHEKVPCDISLWIAQLAQEIWEELRADFPEETRDGFVLDVIHDPRRGPGWKPWNESQVVINLAQFFLDITHPSFEARERSLRGIVAEELYHIAYARHYGVKDYVFQVDKESDQYQLETIIYYARNDFEYEALRFSVRVSGDREELLREIEDYLAGKKKIEIRKLLPT